MDLKEEITTCLDSMYGSGEFAEIVKKQVSAFLNDKMASIFRWGDFAKAFEKKLNEELCSGLGDLSLQQYNQAIMQLMEKEIANSYVEVAKQHMQKGLSKIFVTPPTEYKLSQLVDAIKEDLDPENHGSQISLHVEDSYGSSWIYIDPKEDVKKYDCHYRMLVGSRELKTIRLFEVKTSYRDQFINVMTKPYYGGLVSTRSLEAQMFHMIIAETKFIIDVDSVNHYYSE